MVTKNAKTLAKEAAEKIEEYSVHFQKAAEAPEWLKSYMKEQYPAREAGRLATAEMSPALENGQMMYVAPDASNLQGIAMAVGAKTLAEFMAAHMSDPAKAKALAGAAHADLAAHWGKIVETKGERAPVIKGAFEDVFSKYGLGAFASSETKLAKLAQKLQKKYMK